jgi:hypothetical protein
MSLKHKIKSAKPRETTVVIDGDAFLVRGVGRIQKNELVAKSQNKGSLNNANLEANLLAACVLDPVTFEQVMADPADWDVPSHIAGPLVRACIEVCGFDDDEAKQIEKKSETAES